MEFNRLIRKFRPNLLGWLRRSRSGQVSLLKHFSYKDIKRATDSFHRIIYGNSRCVAYKAKFCDGDIALVKEVKGFDQRDDIFEKELQLLVQLHHRHILGLRGFSAGKKRLLVFDNIENGTLKERLNDPLKTPLSWRTRLRIASGVTAALEYLLLFNSPPTYHVSVNSGSIMLDQNFTAKLSDVGLLSSLGNYAAMPDDSCSEDSVDQLCGNIIFQLGVLILELITGQSSEGSTDLIQWIKESRFGNSIHKMIDPDLGNSYNSRELKSLLAIARLCINSGSTSKASVMQIFRYIQKKYHGSDPMTSYQPPYKLLYLVPELYIGLYNFREGEVFTGIIACEAAKQAWDTLKEISQGNKGRCKFSTSGGIKNKKPGFASIS